MYKICSAEHHKLPNQRPGRSSSAEKDFSKAYIANWRRCGKFTSVQFPSTAKTIFLFKQSYHDIVYTDIIQLVVLAVVAPLRPL